MVLAVGDDQADVGQHRPGFEVLAGGRAEGAQLRDGVEQVDGEAGDVHRVRRVVIAAIDELADAAPRDIAQVVDLGAVRAAG